MNVGPADCMVFTRKAYHQRLCGLPIKSIGVDNKTGTKRTKRYMKRFAVSKGSHMLSIRKVRTGGVRPGLVGIGATHKADENGSKQIAFLRREKRAERVNKSV